MELYKQISDANRIKYGTEAEKILRIIINQYSDRTHFIYEILQNAEDAGATRIQFHLEKEKLVIKHDGRPFNEKDIEGVCGIANGTKEDGTRIGHFGIGFKSVYCYTEHPYIYSGEYHFVIQNQLFPKEVPGSQEIAYDETCMILPFDKGEVPSSIAYQEIRDALTKKITAESIIMLNQISDVRIKIDGYPEKIEINKAKYSLDKKAYADNVFGLSMNTTITNTRSKQTRTKDADYLFFTDANAEATAIIFRVEGKELKAIKNSKIYAFFPTAKEAHQNFYIHAPFDTTPARDNFKEGAEYGKHNIKLIKAVGELIWFAFQWMKNHQYLSISGFNTVFPVYEYEADDVLYGIYQNSIDMIREEALLPTNVPGEFKKIQEICVPLWGIIVDTFDDNDLRALRRKRNISWLAKEFSTEAYHDVRAFLNQNFKLETLEWKDLVLNMDAFFLSQKQLSWMEALMSRIESYCIKRATYDSHYIDVSQIPFVRTVSQEQICARDEHGKLQVYLNNPDIAKYRIESTFIKNESIRSFYRRALEIPEYNIEQETIENILPKYESANVKFKTKDPITENIDDLKVIKDAIYTNTSILERIKDKYIVTDGKNWYRPEEMYLRSNDTRSGYALVKGIVRIKYLADTYFDGTIRSLKLDEDFFKKIGCNAGIRMIPASRDEYLRAIRKYCGAKAESDYRTNIFFKTYVVECLPPEKVNSLQKRFIFIDYQKDTNDCEVSSHSLVINGKLIEMTKIILSDFGILYDALSAKKAALPVKLLRRFKDELYSFALTQQPGPTMQVAALDDGRIDENMLALSIGLASTGVYGLARAVNSEQWYRNIILHDSMYSCDKLLEYVYPELAKQNSWKLPVWYYIANSDYKSSLAESKAPHSYNDIVSEDSIKRNRTAIAGRTAMEIWTQEKTNVFKAIRLLGFLPEDKIDVEQYQQILETIFKENANILSSSNTSDRSSLKRMIRIYDFLLYRQKKTP